MFLKYNLILKATNVLTNFGLSMLAFNLYNYLLSSIFIRHIIYLFLNDYHEQLYGMNVDIQY